MDTHTDLQAGTQAQTQSQMGAHANMPSLALVSLKAVTHRAVQSGDWSDPATWENGDVPTDWAKVHIPAGVDVRIDGTGGASVKTVRVDGTLSFATDVDTTLKVDTLVTTDTGHLIIGTEEAPISANVDAKIIFADDGAIDKNWDPSLISRGALLHGKTTINGAEKTAYGAVSDFPMAGDQSLTLKAAPMGWKVGDKIVIAGTNPSDPTSDETVTITAIDGAVISFQPPLALNHAAPKPDLDVHVANLTRNVEFSSENEALAHRGHVMVMHTNDAAINYAGFEGLGRSDKRIGYNDHEFVDLSPFIDPIELGGDNVRGRYALHFHKGGTDKDSAPAKVMGSVATDSPSWGFVSHSSHVEFTQNVTHGIVGAAYFTEAGDEIGSFVENIAIRTVNPDMPLKGAPGDELFDPDAREQRQDYGLQGDGFWFHGPNVKVEGNIVSGASGHAYIWWPEGLLEKTADGKTQKVFHDAANVPNGDLIGPDGTKMQIYDVPIGSFIDNQAYSTTRGVQIFYLHSEFFGEDQHLEDGTIDPPDSYDAQLRSTLSNTTIWNVDQTAVAAPYANRLTFDNLRLVGDGDPNSIGIDLSHFLNDIGLEVKNPNVEGFGVGLRTSTNNTIALEGGAFADNGADTLRVAPTGGDDDEATDGDDSEEPFDDGDDAFADDDLDDEDAFVDDPENDDPVEDPVGDASSSANLNSIEGSSGRDRLIGQAADDLLVGGRGADTLKGRGGDDVLIGGLGADRLLGGGGKDRLEGGAGRDVLYGRRGDDTLDGGVGPDKMYGGLGADVFVFSDRGRDRVFDYKPGVDRLDFSNWSASSADDLRIISVANDWFRIIDTEGGAIAHVRIKGQEDEFDFSDAIFDGALI